MNNIKLINIEKSYKNEKVLKGINIEIFKGDFISLLGASGSGKSTLLNMIAGIDTPDNGDVYVSDYHVNKIKSRKLDQYRNKELGFIYQSHNLLQDFTVLENVMLPALVTNSVKEAQKEAEKLLEIVGLSNKKNNLPKELSGGQSQRVAICRALINKPQLILADEPTGNLDSQNSLNIIKLLKDLNDSLNTTFVIATHDEKVALNSKKTFNIKDGKIIDV